MRRSLAEGVYRDSNSRRPLDEVRHWLLTTSRDRLVKIGAEIVRHGRSIAFQMAEVMVPGTLFQQILDAIASLRLLPTVRC